jgi:hypothetical protein
LIITKNGSIDKAHYSTPLILRLLCLDLEELKILAFLGLLNFNFYNDFFKNVIIDE